MDASWTAHEELEIDTHIWKNGEKKIKMCTDKVFQSNGHEKKAFACWLLQRVKEKTWYNFLYLYFSFRIGGESSLKSTINLFRKQQQQTAVAATTDNDDGWWQNEATAITDM